MKPVTILFLIKQSGDMVTHICLAMKKRGFGVGKWNGVGGKVEAGETSEDAARREAREEIGVSVGALRQVADIGFYYEAKPGWNQQAAVYFATEWSGEVRESAEMRPAWYAVDEIPYAEMWSDDAIWLPKVLAGAYVRGDVHFGGENQITSHTL